MKFNSKTANLDVQEIKFIKEAINEVDSDTADLKDDIEALESNVDVLKAQLNGTYTNYPSTAWKEVAGTTAKALEFNPDTYEFMLIFSNQAGELVSGVLAIENEDEQVQQFSISSQTVFKLYYNTATGLTIYQTATNAPNFSIITLNSSPIKSLTLDSAILNAGTVEVKTRGAETE